MKKLLLAGALSCALPSLAAAADFTFVVQNNHYYAVEIRFFSADRTLVWPEPGLVWTNRSSVPERYTLSCYQGQRVCFGASAGRAYWGMGVNGNYGCASCCRFCIDGAETEVINLN